MYAAEGFLIIWIDDDIRFRNHINMESDDCFCPLHVVGFNRKADVEVDREQIVANCMAPGNPISSSVTLGLTCRTKLNLN